MSTDFDPHSSWLPLRERAATTENPRHRRLLEEVANHMEAEIQGQLEPLMATLTDQPVYHFWRVGPENMMLSGYDAVSSFYQAMFANGGEQFQVVIERICVDDHAVITEGQVRQVYKASDLIAMGVTEINNRAIDDHQLWLSNAQLITVWPADPKAKLIGEDIYFGADPMTTLTPINEEDLPSYYRL